MAETLTKNGFFTETTEQQLTEEMQTEFSDLMEDENSLLSEETNRSEDEIPSTQVQRQT